MIFFEGFILNDFLVYIAYMKRDIRYDEPSCRLQKMITPCKTPPPGVASWGPEAQS